MVDLRDMVGFVVGELYSVFDGRDFVSLDDLHKRVVGSVIEKYGFSLNAASDLYNPVYWVVVLDKNGPFDLVPRVSMNNPPSEHGVVRRMQKEKPVEIPDDIVIGQVLSRYGETLEARFSEFLRARR